MKQLTQMRHSVLAVKLMNLQIQMSLPQDPSGKTQISQQLISFNLRNSEYQL